MTACHIRILLNASYDQLKPEYGIPRSKLKCYLSKICPPLQCRNVQHVHQMLKRGEVSRSKVLKIIKMSVQKNKVGRPTYLNSDEEELVIASSEIEGVHGIPINVNTLGAELQLVIKSVKGRQSTKDITANSSSKYTRSVIKRVNRKEDGHYIQRKNTRTGLVKVSIIINKRARQIDSNLAYLMFYKIAQMYRDIREQESE